MIVAGLLMTSMHAEEKAPAPADTTADLQRRIAELERENLKLKAKVEELESLLPIQRMLQESKTPPIVNLAPPKDQVPDNWVPRPFNGVTYYVVPLK